jgi:predicted  nucleic acid-binding Zn-ribbon protein
MNLSAYPELYSIGTWLLAAGFSFLFMNEHRRMRKIEENADDAARLVNLGVELEKKEKELNRLEEDLKEANKILAERDFALEQVNQANEKLENLTTEIKNLDKDRGELEELRREQLALETSLAELKQDKRILDDQIEEAHRTKSKLEEDCEGLEKRARDFEEKRALAEEELKIASASLAEAKLRVTEIEAEIRKKGDEISKLATELSKLESKVSDTNSRLIKEEQELDQLELKLQARHQEISSLDGRQKNLEERIQEHNLTLTDKANRIKELEEKHSLVTAELTQANSDLNKIKDEISKGQEELEDLRSDIKTHESLKNNLPELAKGFQDLVEGTGKYSDKAGGLRYKDLWEPYIHGEFPHDSTKDEKDKFQDMEHYIKNEGLVFPQRVLAAFHTALKINDISPILVLAGISGTGKSELPRRYAEGMGMHFVALAVQPRWDSPQDLFGFYNYLEHRYKATELARALVQFECYNRILWDLPEGWEHGLEDEVLLVLLDEMNLARVEYYFSEFLSKLEIRRGIDPGNSQQRAKAEISLEMGALQEGEKPICLYPANNVLFTGTMNEDETTQALSDKVLDRASVLRFGRPKSVELRQTDTVGKFSEHILALDTWKSWYVPSKTNPNAELSDWINKVNELMDEMHRPYGHRVGQAIHSYILNYPSWISGSGNVAKADQIEQRILPKLRGIDVDEHRKPLENLAKVVGELGDDLLTQAFRNGYEGKYQFIWRGLDRMEDQSL